MRLDAPDWLPAPAQGVIAIECRGDDAAVMALCRVLDHAPTRTCASAERALNLALHGSCHVPVAAFARLDGDTLRLDGLVGSEHDGRRVRASAESPASTPDALGQDVAARLLAAGAAEFLPAS
jgi:hydroxymethylbilane synthase